MDAKIAPQGVKIARDFAVVMAVGAAGHAAVRIVGPRFGLPMAGFASGFVSSTATIAAFGVRAAKTPALLRPAAAGAVLSSVATIAQMSLMLVATVLQLCASWLCR